MYSARCVALLVFLGLVCASLSLTITHFPHYQTFDSWQECYEKVCCYERACPNLLGGWVNEEFAGMEVSTTGNDMRNWWVKSGITESNYLENGTVLDCNNLLTGPCGDATSGSGKYIYAEASGCFGAYFWVRSPKFLFTTTPASLSFSYYMYGLAIKPSGTVFTTDPNPPIPAQLNWYVTYDNGTTFTQIWTSSTENPTSPNSPWPRATVSLPLAKASLPVLAQFRLEVIASGNWYGYDSERVWEADIAIDDVLVTQAGASNVTVPYIDPVVNASSTPTPTPTYTGNGNLGGGGGGLSNGAIAGIVVGIVAGLCCLCLLLLLLVLLVLLLVSPRKPPASGGDGM